MDNLIVPFPKPAMDDPFVSQHIGSTVPRDAHRYSSFDTQLFSLDASEPAQVKRALEAHLAETERRLEEASKLGTALIQQQKELSDKLIEVERQQDEGEIGPELRRKLMDLEREYNEIGRETARAFLAPKRILSGGEDGVPSTPGFEHKSPVSPALFTSQATNSPSKVSVPSRKQRNQPSNRVNDIEFAAEISTSLLAQVRQLQALLAEREDALKAAILEKSRLELEAEGYSQRIRALDESEQRYKDENWSLETQTRELMAAVKEAADRETRLNSGMSAVAAEKTAVERELEELKHANAKLLEEQTVAQKANDAEIHLLRRNLHAVDAEKSALQQKLEELNSQNQELAKAVAMRFRQHNTEAARDASPDMDTGTPDHETPENSPPPSPNKFTPRHNHLESETLKSSLGHAHRMIQNLRGTIHREKTEKIELKRMLQEARDELEQRRRDGPAPAQGSNKRQKTKADAFKKPPRPDLLGSGRRARTEVELDDAEWEDNRSPTRGVTATTAPNDQSDDPSDVYQTATEAEDAFETANERETTTESEAFQTGIESMADDTDTDDLTETEDTARRTLRRRVPSNLTINKARNRMSYQSTATSGDEDDEIPSPSAASHHRLKMKRSVLRRIRPSGEAPMASNSRPPSARDSPASSFTHDAQQSLFAELAELAGGDNDEEGFPTPSRSEAATTPRTLPPYDSRRPSEATLASIRMRVMIDAGIMTEPWEPQIRTTPRVVDAVDETPVTPVRASARDVETPRGLHDTPKLVHSGTQWTPLRSPTGPNGEQFVSVPTPPKMVWDDGASDAEHVPMTPAAQLPQLNLSDVFSQHTVPAAPVRPTLTTSYVIGGETTPVEHVTATVVPPNVAVSSIASQHTQPVTPRLPVLSVSPITSQHTAPVVATVPEAEPQYAPELSFSSVTFQHTAPEHAQLPDSQPVPVPQLAISPVSFEQTDPVLTQSMEPTRSVPVPEPHPHPSLTLSTVLCEDTVPAVPRLPSVQPTVTAEKAIATDDAPQLELSFLDSVFTEPAPIELRNIFTPAAPQLALSSHHAVETTPVRPAPVAPVVAPLAVTALSETADNSRERMQGRSTSEQQPAIGVAEDTTASEREIAQTGHSGDANLPLGVISGNCGSLSPRQPPEPNRADHGAQTILSSKQIDQLLTDRGASRPLSPPESEQAKELPGSPLATPKARPRQAQSLTSSTPRRPSSAASQASSVLVHPPLPADHREVIMAAEKQLPSDKRPPSSGLMGPPLAPASAYKATGPGPRPRTPNEQMIQPALAKTTSSRAPARCGSQVSRQSSISSFASEIEERFNIQGTPSSLPPSYGPGTDPRMIQAITQTMIGEFLWKYTRKAVTGEISNTRHRRYFWVHPYTRTLYWSDRDPQSVGKSQAKTKSVPIEAVRVITDNNIYPPGLHRKSLEVVSPGRRVRFTATTSQRHETWFNALSYLLVRDSDEREDHESNVTIDDVEEFNPRVRSASRLTTRMSVSSYNSRASRTLPKQRAASAMAVRPAATPGRVSPALSAPGQSSLHVAHPARQSSASRISTIFNSTIRGSFSSLRGRPSPSQDSVAESSADEHGHADDGRSHKHEPDDDRLENVRACCDGKHDVTSLPRISRFSPKAKRTHVHP